MTVPFIPTKDFETTIDYYKALGFQAKPVQSGKRERVTFFMKITCSSFKNICQRLGRKHHAKTIYVSDLEAFISNLQEVLKAFPEARFKGPRDFGWGNQIY